ncbi:MAG: hypothetical protein HY749_12665 [Gammaproteobacteria bacterium]|nr:hypothetical protein [Gammaproteobacteria bacterium]
MTYRNIAAMGFVLAFATSGAGAVSFQTGTELVAECASDKVTEQSFCNGFLAGMAEAHDLYRNWYGMKPAWCMPPGVTTADMRKSITAYGTRHQAELIQPAGAIAATAFTETYPCAPAP